MFDALRKIEAFNELERELIKAPAPLTVTGCMGSQKIQLTAELQKGPGHYNWILYVCRDEKTALDVINDFRMFNKNIWIYPAKDLLFYNSDIHGSFITFQRMDALRHLMEDESGILVTSIDALMDKIASEEAVRKAKLDLFEGMIISTENLSKILVSLNYERVPQVEMMGQFAVRGGIVDIYPMTMDEPYRIEFFDDEIDTIRSFELSSQRSVDRLEKINIYPASEQTGIGDSSLLDHISSKSLIVLDDPVRLRERAAAVELEFSESLERRLEKGIKTETGQAADIFSADVIFDKLKERRSLLISGLDDSLRDFGSKKSYHIKTAATGSYKESIELLISEIKKLQKEKYRITVLTPSKTRASRLAENLREYEIRAYCPDEGTKEELKAGDTEVIYGSLKQGYIYPDIKYALITESDMFGGRTRYKKRKTKHEGQEIHSLSELAPGDYVVHESHGIGIYRGIDHVKRDDTIKDYIKIEYADGGNLYLPASKLDLVQKFANAEAKAPKLNRLHGGDWQKTKQRAISAINNTARELIELYAKRLDAEGFRYSKDTVWQKEFEELFPYEETEDQINAIEAVKSDMESGNIMDRLVCGDVGYGKTEIALRAAFKAVQDGRQVAYLVPTTILAEQHYETFSERLKNFPVEVDLMCRFRTTGQNKATAAKLKNGSVDIVIGTHRLLSKDVGFKNLGLLIIDEEQRFGVVHKEKIKQLKSNVDVLTLTATPIPRTLHMSLSGIRDLSTLEEPPFDRVPIQTYVMEYNDEFAREAINRELSRNGQVFYVFNSVNGISDKTDKLREMVPDARIEYAHGQMNEHELESIMRDFVNGEIDVLVSTTIIETGLDIPNANTLIVDGAERLGLSQLYQIRGRVGRSSRTAYAFFMYKKDKVLSEEAEKRLQAIREFTEFGAGIKIAMRDLEIRGAGNVLGEEQHGQIQAVGYELYCKLLSKAVGLLRGKLTDSVPEFETSVECDMDAFIPQDYITDEHQKLDVYKHIAEITNEEEYMDIIDELLDRFGEIPIEVMNLLAIARLKARAHEAYVTDLFIRRDGFIMNMYPKADINVDAIPELIREEKGKLKFSSGRKPKFIYKDEKAAYRDTMNIVDKVYNIVTRLLKNG